MKRREFLHYSSLASTSLLVPSFLQNPWKAKRERSRSGKILVVIQLSGGNDGLNTIVPYRNDVYYRERPRLAVAKKEVLPVSDELGFNPALEALRGLYDDGRMSIINNVGYPNPDRSHFRSMDIWHTASAADEYRAHGWLGSWLDSQCHACDTPYHALEVDDSLSLALKGKARSGFAMSSPERLQRSTENRFLQALGSSSHHGHDHAEVAYLYKTMIDTQDSAQYLFEQSQRGRTQVDFPATRFGQELALVARLILADTDTQVYYVSLTGFDTHANQKNQQERLLRQYAEGVAAFTEELRRHDLLDDTLVLTFSEFGRRVAQNASNGTDHGAANNLFLMGGGLRSGGFYNEGPDLLDLADGDVKYAVDFRSVYATVLERWLDASPKVVLGDRFGLLDVLG